MSKGDNARVQRGALTADEAEALFANVDETGHTNEETAAKERRRRLERGHGVEVDPLAGDDPSGSNVEKVITRTAVGFVAIFLFFVVVAQVSCGVARRVATANLSQDVTLETVASALRGGVEWGNGFTHFPEDFVVREADENTHRVVVTVTDASSKDALQCFAGSQIQATAFSVNALLNPNVDTVVYNVDVHVDGQGKLQRSALFGFLKPTGEVRRFMTFVWTKTTTEYGVRFNCAITGVDEKTQEELRDSITSSFTPSAILGSVLGGSTEEDAVLDGDGRPEAEDDADAADEAGGTDKADETGQADETGKAGGAGEADETGKAGGAGEADEGIDGESPADDGS